MSAGTPEVKKELEKVELTLTKENKRSQEQIESKKKAELLSDIPGIQDYFPGLDLNIPIDADLSGELPPSDGMPQTCDGQSALFVAVNKLMNPDLVKLLLEHGVETNLELGYLRNLRISPLMVACRTMPAETLALLLKYGANYLLRDDAGNSVFDWAISEQPPMNDNVTPLETRRKTLIENYRAIFRVKMDEDTPPGQVFRAFTAVNHNKTKIEQLYPLLAQWAETFYNSFSKPQFILNEYLSTHGISNGISNIIALYNTMPLDKISKILEDNPDLFIEIKEQLLHLLKTAHNVCNNHDPKDNSPEHINAVLSLMYSDFKTLSSTEIVEPEVEPEVVMHSESTVCKGDGKSSLEKKMILDESACRGDGKSSAETKTVAEKALVTISNAPEKNGFFLSWGLQAWISSCRRQCKSRVAQKNNTNRKVGQ